MEYHGYYLIDADRLLGDVNVLCCDTGGAFSSSATSLSYD
jgi:hypothetical protein